MSGGVDRTVADQDWFQAPELQCLLDLLNRDGGEARIVGGAVRNALMGLAVSDVDLATTCLPEDVMARATAAGIKAVPTGIEHGTVTLVLSGRPYEVTTLRTDVETDGRRARVAFGSDWQADARRRDLTMNALYARADGSVVDLVGGLEDIAAGTVRFIGVAAERIAEDHLRILRFFRFFAWYGRGRPDADGLKASARAKDRLMGLSAERVWAETKKLLAAPDPSRALLWMRQTGVLTVILPESERWGIDAIPALLGAEAAFGWPHDPLLRLAAILPPDPPRLAALAERLKVSRAEAERLTGWAAMASVDRNLSELALDRLLYRSDPGAVIDRLKLDLAVARARAASDSAALVEAAGQARLLRRAEIWKRPRFPLSGRDLLELGLPAGPAIGRMLERLESRWVDSNFRLSREALLAEIDADGDGPGAAG